METAPISPDKHNFNMYKECVDLHYIYTLH